MPQSKPGAARRLKHLSNHVQPQNVRSIGDRASDAMAIMTEKVVLTEHHGGELVAEVLKAHGVDFIFCLSGGHISPFLVASNAKDIRIVDVRHEVNAVFAADGIGRLTGKPGVAAVTAGPGVTNTVTAIKNCAMAQSPMVLLGGAAATAMKGRGALQDIDQMAVLTPIVKWSYACQSVRDIVPALRTAFQQAASGVPGPVFVELPLDVLYNCLEVYPMAGVGERARAKDIGSGEEWDQEALHRVVLPAEAAAAGMDRKKYLQSKNPDQPVFLEPKVPVPWPMRKAVDIFIAQLHAGVWDEKGNPVAKDFSPLPVQVPQPTAADVSECARLLMEAKRPVCLVGSQATLMGPGGSDGLRAALESMGIPCFLGGMARGLLGGRCPFHIRQNRGKALRSADFVLMLGMIPDFRMDYGRTLPGGGVPIVSVNRSREDLGKNASIYGVIPLFWSARLSCEADPCTFCVQLADTIKETLSPQAPLRAVWANHADSLKAQETAKESDNSAKALEAAYGHGEKAGKRLVNPLQLCETLERVLPEDSVIVADGGDFVATAAYILRPRGPLRWLDPGAFGTLGVGAGFALAAKLVRPSAEVWLIWGDGSAGYGLVEFDSFTRHKVEVLALVGNDAMWKQIEREQTPMFQDPVSCELSYANYHAAAAALGAKGIEVTAYSDADSLEATLREAQAAARGEDATPVLVNVHVGETNFREGSLSV